MSRIAVKHIGSHESPCDGCASGKHTPFFWVDDRVEGEWTATPAAEGWSGLVHGSAIAALHDEAAAWAMMIVLARTGFTTRLDVRYLRPIRIGDRVVAVGRVAEHDEQKATFATEIILPNGKVASTASVEYMFMEDPALLEKMLGKPLGSAFLEWLQSDATKRRALNVREAELLGR
jgi:uncharacterized protein (TIGR00369 family)